MRKDKVAQLTVRDLNKMTKVQVRNLAGWMRSKALELDDLTEPGQPWLVTRKKYAPLFNMSLMK